MRCWVTADLDGSRNVDAYLRVIGKGLPALRKSNELQMEVEAEMEVEV